MRKVIYGSLLIVIFLSVACDELDQLSQFNLKHTTNTTLPKETGINVPINLVIPVIDANVGTELSNNNTSTEQVQSIYLKKLDLHINSPSDLNFDFLSSISVFISADGLNEIKIAYLSEIPDEQIKFLELEIIGQNLKEYIINDNFSLRINAVTDQLVDSDIDLRISSEFLIDATAYGD